MENELENLRKAVEGTGDLEGSAMLLVQGVAERLKSFAARAPAGGILGLVEALANDLMTFAKPLAAAVPANTHAAQA